MRSRALNCSPKIYTLQAEHNEQVRALWSESKDYNQALADKAKVDSRKEPNVPAAMTLANRMFQLSLQDQIDAVTDFESEKEAYGSFKHTAEQIEAFRQQGQPAWRTEAILAALAGDPLDEKEIEARVRDGRIPSVEQRDKSFQYRTKVDQYHLAKGKVSRQAKKGFERLRNNNIIRVFRDINVLFTTCNNAGSELVTLGSSPDVIYIDEAGQLTMAGLANVLTSFARWLATIILGDPNQLKPFVISGRANEFRENAILSTLALFEEKGISILRLVLQYRMAPAISTWMSAFFYRGLLQNQPSVFVDSQYRRVARAMSKDIYGIAGPERDGSEYWMIDVANGVSQAQVNRTSLHNYANATVIANLGEQALSKGVEASKITVLVYYSGQLSVVAHKTEVLTQANGREWKLTQGQQISLVNSFQGEENWFVFVAHKRSQPKKTAEDDEDSEEDDGSEGFRRSGRVTAHVKSANRLCCALKRWRSWVVIISQLTALLATVRMKQAILDEEMRKKYAEDPSFRNTRVVFMATTQYQEETQDRSLTVHHTPHRRTTRPNMSGTVATQADAHDIQSGRSLIVTEAGAFPLTMGSGTQRAVKTKRKARKKEAESKKKDAEEETETKKGKSGKKKAAGGGQVQGGGGGEGAGEGEGGCMNTTIVSIQGQQMKTMPGWPL